ncbi:hypothetical protein Q9189_000357 [Teloschistes chrysophthalmus]
MRGSDSDRLHQWGHPEFKKLGQTYQESDEEIIPIGLGATANSALDEEPNYRSSRTSTTTIKVRKTYKKRRLEPANPPCSSGQGLIDEDHQTRNSKGDLDPAVGTDKVTRNRKKRSRRHAPVNELPLIGTIDVPAVPEIIDAPESVFADEHIESCNSPGAPPEFRVPISVKHKPVAGRQPISSIKNSICLSKSTDINLHDFRLPPKTPSSARSRAWKPGSGFKGMTKAKSIKKSAAPNLRNQDKTSDLTQEVGQGRHKASGEHQEGGFLACRKSLLATEPPNVSMPGIDPPNRAYSSPDASARENRTIAQREASWFSWCGKLTAKHT